MTEVGVSEAEQRLAVHLLADVLGERGFKILLLGSVAVLFKSGQGGLTKDVDVHVPPSEDYESYYDALDWAVQRLGGPPPKLATDGSSITLWIPVEGRDVPVEVIEGREDFIDPVVLSDGMATATHHNDLYPPVMGTHRGDEGRGMV